MFEITKEERSGEVRFHMEGELDLASVDRFEQEISSTVVQTVDRVVLNFEGVKFIDSTGIGVLIKLIQTLEVQNIPCRVEQVNENIMEIFEILGVQELLIK